MRHAAKAILSYWRSVAPETGAPERSAIDPRALKAHLPDLFILERMDRAVFAFRLAGTRLCARYGRELRDHDFVRLWQTRQHGQILGALNQTLQNAEPVLIKGAAATLDGKSVPFDIVLMPLNDAEGRPTRILGAMITQDNVALRDGVPLISQAFEHIAVAAVEDAPLDFAATAAFTAARETHVSFLRVVDGDKDDRAQAVTLAERNDGRIPAAG